MPSNRATTILDAHRLSKKMMGVKGVTATALIVAILVALLSSERVVASSSTVSTLSTKIPTTASSSSVFGITTQRPVITLPPSLLSIRGGSDIDELSEDEYDSDDESDDDDDEDLFDDFEMGDGEDGMDDDFGEDNTLDRLIVAFHKTPPLTKAYLTASFAATAMGYALNNNEFPSILLLDWKPIATRLQIWRPLTAFLNFGGFGLSYLLTVNFVWTYMSTLERLHHRKPYDFWIMIIFGMSSMVIGYSCLQLSPKFLGHNLSTFLVYVWSRYHEGVEVNMFELFNTKAELLPWFFLAQVRFLLQVVGFPSNNHRR